MRLGNLERSVMEALWAHPEGILAQDLAAALPSSPAVTTVLTVLVRLSRKGLATRERAGRAHLYRAAAGKDAFVAEAMREALDEAGDVEAAVNRFVGAVSPEVAAALRAALTDRPDLTTPGETHRPDLTATPEALTADRSGSVRGGGS